MKKSVSGFTIVELLIVIVVIAILAAISVVAYTGIQQRANNSSRIAVGDQWVKTFKIYEAQTGNKPPSIENAAVSAKFCLGTGFPIGGGGVARCQNVTGTDGNSPAESANATLMSELEAVTSLPTAKPIRSAGITGPYFYRYSSYDVVMLGLDGVYAVGTDCGGGFISVWTNSVSSGCEKRI